MEVYDKKRLFWQTYATWNEKVRLALCVVCGFAPADVSAAVWGALPLRVVLDAAWLRLCWSCCFGTVRIWTVVCSLPLSLASDPDLVFLSATLADQELGQGGLPLDRRGEDGRGDQGVLHDRLQAQQVRADRCSVWGPARAFSWILLGPSPHSIRALLGRVGSVPLGIPRDPPHF